jgi:uncharacterized protein with FMN-binding domain
MRGGSRGKIGNNLLALSSAAVLAVYAAGYARTRPFAAGFNPEAMQRNRTVEVPPAARRVTPPARRKAPVPVTPDIASVSPPMGHAEAPASLFPASKDSSLPASVARQAAAPEPAAAVAPSPAPAAAPQAAATQMTSIQAPATQMPAPVASAAPAAAAPHAHIMSMAEAMAGLTAGPAAKVHWQDGTYFGWGYSPHGDILAQVVIDGGRIASATVSECKTRYSCSDIADLPGQVVARQRPDVDIVSGATESSQAFSQGVYEALNQAK